MRVGLIGAGYISQFHARGVRLCPGAELVAVCDPRLDSARQLADQFGVRSVHADLDRMLDSEALDAVHVLTPADLHVPIALRALASGVDVLVEKPATTSVRESDALADALQISPVRKLGVSHNFLFLSAAERFLSDVRGGVFGPISTIEVLWAQGLPQLHQRAGRRPWLLREPANLMHETGPHVFSLVVLACGKATTVEGRAWDEERTEDGWRAFRKWDVILEAGSALATVRFDFTLGAPSMVVRVRGLAGTAVLDLARNTYVRRLRTRHGVDLDQLLGSTLPDLRAAVQGGREFAAVAAGKLGIGARRGAYADSIAAAVRAQHALSNGQDPRLTLALARECSRIAELATSSLPPAPTVAPQPQSAGHTSTRSHPPTADALIIGGSGFIGRHLVDRLLKDGRRVRVLARDPGSLPKSMQAAADIVRGDVTDIESVRRALVGARSVYYLARGLGTSWDELQATDVEPALAVARACAEGSPDRFVYASSIAIYWAGRRAGVITENTPFSEAMERSAPYSRSKVAIEAGLQSLRKERDLDVVVVRPGVVLGEGSSPQHWGVACWISPTVCSLWGSGTNHLPIVLVDDVCDALVRTGETSGISGMSFNLSAEPCLSARDYLHEVEVATGVSIRASPMSAWRRYGEQIAKWGVKRASGNSTVLRPSFEDCDARSLAAYFDCSLARTRLDWRPTDSRDTIISEGIHRPAVALFGRPNRAADWPGRAPSPS